MALSDVALENAEALADGEINPLCIYGCVDACGSCFCYIHYWYYKDATHLW
jgi:hypothetical protein